MELHFHTVFSNAVKSKWPGFHVRQPTVRPALVKRAVLLLMLLPYLIKTDMMAADIFTKATPRDTFIKMRNFLMNINWTTRITLGQSFV